MLCMFQFKRLWANPSSVIHASVGMKRNSTYTKFFKQFFYDFISNGLLDIYEKRADASYSSCTTTNTNENGKPPTGFSKLASLFLILSFGIFGSLSIFIYECCSKKSAVLTKNQEFINVESYVESYKAQLLQTMKEETMKYLEHIQQSRNMVPKENL